MSKASFQLVYDIEESEIDAKQLSIALHAMSELLEEADALINGRRTKTRVNVKASFQTGSFKIDFSSAQSLLKKVQETLLDDKSHAVVPASDLISYLFTGASSLWKLFLFLKGNKPTKIFETADGKFRVYKGDKYLDFEKYTIKLYEDYKLRQSFEEIVSKQLEHEQIKAVVVIDSSKNIVEAKKEESSYFLGFVPEQSKLDEGERETILSLVNVSFKEGNKWRVTDGANSFYVIVEDEKYIEGIKSGDIRIGSKDYLKVKLKETQYFGDAGLKKDYVIREVLEHHIYNPSVQQSLLDLDYLNEHESDVIVLSNDNDQKISN